MKAFQGGAHISCKPNSWPPWAHSNSGWMVVGVVGTRWGWWVLGWEWGGPQDASVVFAYYGAGSHCRFCPLCKREKQAGTQTKQKAGKDGTEGGETGSPGALVWMDAECLCFFGDNEERLRAKGLFTLSDLPHRKKFKIPRAVFFLTRYLGFAQFYE